MALTDRDPSYMKEKFGTTSLITDYHPVKKDTLSIEDVIAQLEHIIKSEETLADLQADSSDFIFTLGEVKCAKMILQLLEKLK
jgi:hypothetical protein